MKRSNYHIVKRIRAPFIAVFLISISLPLIDWVMPINISTEYDASENRTLSKMPAFKINKLTKFPQSFEDFFNDNMNFREDLLNLNGYIGLTQIKKESGLTVDEGKEGWFYLHKYLKAYKNKEIFSEAGLDSLKEMFTHRGKWLKQKGIHSYLAIIPSKGNIYPEYLPNYIFQYQQLSRSDQMLQILKENKDIKGIDLSESLLEAKKRYPEYPLFYKTDQHWSDFGALIGLKQILDTIQKDFPQINTIEINDYNISIEECEGKQLAKVLKKQLVDINLKLTLKDKCPEKTIQQNNYQNYSPHPKFPYPNEFIINYKSENKKPKVLLIRDSFSNALHKRFKEGCKFGHITMVWDNWCYRLNEEIVEKEEPQIYLTIIIDGNIPLILSHLPDYR